MLKTFYCCLPFAPAPLPPLAGTGTHGRWRRVRVALALCLPTFGACRLQISQLPCKFIALKSVNSLGWRRGCAFVYALYPVPVTCCLFSVAFVISSAFWLGSPCRSAPLPSTASRCHYVNEIVANYYFYFSLSIFFFFAHVFVFVSFVFAFVLFVICVIYLFIFVPPLLLIFLPPLAPI